MNVSEKRPSAAFVVAMIAFFVAVGGTAGAAAMQAVPLAKRALMADNAKKLGGQTAAQIASQAAQAPGPASSAAGIVTVKTTAGISLPAADASSNTFTVKAVPATCDAGKILGATFSADGGTVIQVGARPVGDSTWMLNIGNVDTGGPANAAVYATCIK